MLSIHLTILSALLNIGSLLNHVRKLYFNLTTCANPGDDLASPRHVRKCVGSEDPEGSASIRMFPCQLFVRMGLTSTQRQPGLTHHIWCITSRVSSIL